MPPRSSYITWKLSRSSLNTMKIFKKDKDKEKDKDKHESGGHHGKEYPASIRARTSTNSPLLQGSTGGGHHSRKESSDVNSSITSSSSVNSSLNSSMGSSTGSASSGGSVGRSSQQPALLQPQVPGGVDSKSKQHAIRIGDTRFYGRIICRAKALYVSCSHSIFFSLFFVLHLFFMFSTFPSSLLFLFLHSFFVPFPSPLIFSFYIFLFS